MRNSELRTDVFEFFFSLFFFGIRKSMVALKKAYAEIILNTAKEAAARVMASERKALRVQHDLKATKEEGLRMLLRLKQMMDAKVRSLLPRADSLFGCLILIWELFRLAF